VDESKDSPATNEDLEFVLQCVAVFGAVCRSVLPTRREKTFEFVFPLFQDAALQFPAAHCHTHM